MRSIGVRIRSRLAVALRIALAVVLLLGDALLLPVQARAQLEALQGQLEALGIDPTALQGVQPLPAEAGIPAAPRQTDLQLSTENLSGSPALVSGAEVESLSPIEADYERRVSRGL